MLEKPEAGELALIVHIKLRDPRATSDIREFRELVESAGGEIIETITATRYEIDPKFVIGKGKVEEIKAIIDAEGIEIVIFNFDLTPSQEKSLERELKCRVIDRKELILDIFAQRARTFEGKLQVELAQLQHLSTRLIRGWTHLERQKGGIGLRGPGEKQLEVDRRLINNRIKTIKGRLEKVRSQRAQSRRARQKGQVYTVSLVGYTNAGKTTLFNNLANDKQYVADQLFATLDPHLRQIDLRYIGKAILADTVGFIRDLPHELIDAFRATLEETKDADLLLHVIDAGDDMWQERKKQVEVVLHEIGALHIPILEVYNKIDLIEGLEPGVELDHLGEISRVKISATKGLGISDLKEAISKRLCSDVVKGKLTLPHSLGKVRAMLYELGAIDSETNGKDNISDCWIINITVQQGLWKSLCSKFPDLPKYLENIF